MIKHTKEPWTIGDKVPAAIYGADESPICLADSMGECGSPGGDRANAARIVACVNACAGLETESLEACQAIGGLRQIDLAFVIEQGAQKRELIAALEAMLGAFDIGQRATDTSAIGLARSVIAKAKGITPEQEDAPCTYPSGTMCPGDGSGKACGSCPLRPKKGGAV